MNYGYYSEWKKLIPKPDMIDYVVFKLDFHGGYAMKVIKDGFFTPIIGSDISIHIPTNEIRDALDWLKENGYKLHSNSIVQYQEEQKNANYK